jgi:hypothetical protein
MKWEGEEREGLYAAAVRRVHVFIRKCAMLYAAAEGTLPIVTIEQTKAAIAVGMYTAACAKVLIDAREIHSRPEGDMERRFLAWIEKNPGREKRYAQQTLTKFAGSCKAFNQTLRNLIEADRIELKDRKLYLKR